MTQLAALFFVILTLIIFLLRARIAKKGLVSESPSQYFLSLKTLTANEFGNSQTAYFFQMATVYPFFLFAFLGQWWLGLWNILFYTVGIVFFYFAMNVATEKSSKLISNANSLHSFIANVHNEPNLRRFTSVVTIIAFLGLVLFEITWGAVALKVIFNESQSIYYLAMFLLALYVVIYLWTGGQSAALQTDQYQLTIIYIGIHFLTAWLVLESLSGMEESGTINFILILTSTLSLVPIYRRTRSILLSSKKSTNILNALTIASFLFLNYTIIHEMDFSTLHQFSVVIPTEISKADFFALFTLGVLPIFYQFVDMTNWQRICSIATDGNRAGVRKGVIQFLSESPLSWLFPIAIGLLSVGYLGELAPNKDPWEALLSSTVLIEGPFGAILAATALAAIVSIFLSTTDGLITAAGYTFAFDIRARSKAVVDSFTSEGLMEQTWGDLNSTEQERIRQEGKLVVNTGRTFSSILLLTVVCIYIFIDWFSSTLSSQVIGLFLAFYAPMLSFAPAVLVPLLFDKVAHPKAAMYSVGVSSIVAIVIGVYSLNATEVIWQYLAVPVAFALSWVIYLIGLFIKNNSAIE